MNSGGQTVSGVVTDGDGVLLGLELRDGTDRSENLLLHDLHVVGDVGEDCWLDEVTSVTLTLATSLDCGTFLLALLDVAMIESVSISRL